MRVDALASERHFADHMRPVLAALPPERRGTLHTHHKGLPRTGGPVIVSAYGDLRKARRTGRPIVMMEHGAGQTYRDAMGRLVGHTSYAGGGDRAGISLLLVPGPSAARAYAEAGNTTPIYMIGCPKLDPWLDGSRAPRLTDPPTVAVSFHWDCEVVLETRSTWARYLQPFLQAAGRWTILGHAHPRIADTLASVWAHHGIRYAPDFSEILDTANVYACDNSSTMYEFAATGRPVIVLNHKYYRRSVHHGLRFWSAAALGPIVDRPDEVQAAIERALQPTRRMMRGAAAAVAEAYAVTDGTSARRAAAAILAHFPA